MKTGARNDLTAEVVEVRNGDMMGVAKVKIPADAVNSNRAKVASIGPVTSRRLKELGVRVDATAAAHTIDGLLDSIEQEESHNGFS